MTNMSKKVNTGNDSQLPTKEKSVNELLANVTDFIDSVYRDILSPSSRYSLNSTITTPSPPLRRRSLSTSLSSSPDEATGDAAAAGAQTLKSPERTITVASAREQRNMDAEVERINRICDNVDLNLRSIGILVNTGHGSRCMSNNLQNSNLNIHFNIDEVTFTTPPRQAATNGVAGCESRPDHLATHIPESTDILTIDLNRRICQDNQPVDNHNSRTAVAVDDDDEVVVVSSNLPPVIDLCTPNYEEPRRAVINRNELTRRSLANSIDDYVVPIRRRRISNASNDISKKCESDAANRSTKDCDGGATTSQRTPFMCPVCMESCIQRRPTSTKCGHVFCEMCIKQAVRLTRKCPICNTKVNSSHLFRIYV